MVIFSCDILGKILRYHEEAHCGSKCSNLMVWPSVGRLTKYAPWNPTWYHSQFVAFSTVLSTSVTPKTFRIQISPHCRHFKRHLSFVSDCELTSPQDLSLSLSWINSDIDRSSMNVCIELWAHTVAYVVERTMPMQFLKILIFSCLVQHDPRVMGPWGHDVSYFLHVEVSHRYSTATAGGWLGDFVYHV